MPRSKKQPRVTVSVVAMSKEVTSIAEGWNTNVWCVADVRDKSGVFPAMRVRADLVRSGRRVKAVVTELQLGADGKALLPRQVHEVARVLPDLPAEILTRVTLEDGSHPSPDQFVRAMNEATRRPNQTQFEREDEVLRQWEGHYKPKGKTQREAAADMGLGYGSFRTYLSHARARRN